MENRFVAPSGAFDGPEGRKMISRKGNYFFFPLAGAAAAVFFSSFFFFCFPKSFLDIAMTIDMAKFILNNNYYTVFLDGDTRSSGLCASSQMYREATLP